jgi:hypothetical protein
VLVLLLAAGAATAVILAPWDDGDESPSDETAAVSTTTTDTTQAEAAAQAAACESEMGPLLKQLRELDSRLNVGLSYDEYTTEVGDVRVVYDRVVEDVEDPICLTSVGIPAETALNQYAKAASKWGDCFDDIDCDTDAIEPTLRRYWDKASSSLDVADEGLVEMRQPS